MNNSHFEKLALIGLGLIGSSVSRAARRGGLADVISGADMSAATRETALRLGLVDSVHEDPAEAVDGADLVVLCVPVGSCGAVAKAMSAGLRDGAIVSDVGSVKVSVIKDIAPHLPATVHLVPAHPIAGTEQSGPEAGFAELFDNRWCILTPLHGTDEAAVARLRAFWQGLGSNIDTMSPEHHDMVLAITSHLPHLIAYNIVKTADHLERVNDTEVIKYSAGGFRDFTRLASSDPTMWRDVFLNNKDAVLEMLGRFTEDLTDLQRAIRYSDGDTLFQIFSDARRIRHSVIESGQDTAAPDFGRRPGSGAGIIVPD